MEIELLQSVCKGVELVKYAESFFKEEHTRNKEFINPFILYFNKKGAIKRDVLDELSDESVKINLRSIAHKPTCFVLAGETELENAKTNTLDHFYVMKLYVQGLEEGYIYSTPFLINQENVRSEMKHTRYVGSDKNIFYTPLKKEGESSSFNAIKMDPSSTYEYRAAFLIGHMDEARLWLDTKTVIADMYCKLAIDTSKKYELIFEISKFGSMTIQMNNSFTQFQEFFFNEFSPSFNHIKGELQLGNTTLKQ